MQQSLAEAYPQTVSYTCPSSGTKFTRTFAGYPSYASMYAAISTWLSEQNSGCNYRGRYHEEY